MTHLPNNLTAKTLKMSKAGKDVKRFSSKKALYADLGLREPQPNPSSQTCRKKTGLAAKEHKERRKGN
jgi:hypothetical protein